MTFPWLKSDPLSPEQHDRIRAFVDARLLSSELVPEKGMFGATGRMVPDHKVPDRELRKALRTTYADKTSDWLVQARDALGAEAFRDLRDALVDPSRHARALGIDPRNAAQVFAARKYIKAALSVDPTHYPRSTSGAEPTEEAARPTEIDYRYANKMASHDRGGPDVSAKNKLLMQNDPVRRAEVDLARAHPVDIVLSRVFFVEPRSTQTTWTSDRPEPHVEIYGPTREQTRRVLDEQLSGIYRHPETRHVFEALAALIVREKAQIIFSGATFGTGEFGAPYRGVTTGVLGGVEAFYNQKHTVFLPATINAFDGAGCDWALGTFVHEALHMLLNRIVGQACSPVAPGSEEEAELDQALAADRAHRAQRATAPGVHGEARVVHTLVDVLEKDAHYFPGGFDPGNPRHRHVMRLESIVRPMEQVAAGVPRESVRAVAPNLLRFYETRVQPLLEAYAREALGAERIIRSPEPAVAARVEAPLEPRPEARVHPVRRFAFLACFKGFPRP